MIPVADTAHAKEFDSICNSCSVCDAIFRVRTGGQMTRRVDNCILLENNQVGFVQKNILVGDSFAVHRAGAVNTNHLQSV